MSEATPTIESLSVELFADGADLQELRRLAALPYIAGFTTNPTHMRKAGIVNYEVFARVAVEIAGTRPISFEVFADDFQEMIDQARTIATWGQNVFVKIPVTDTTGRSTAEAIRYLSSDGVQLNVTALLTVAQTEDVVAALEPDVPSFISIFAGRVADTGRDPVPIIRAGLDAMAAVPASRMIWASPRELLNIFHADAAGCHVITVTSDLLGKLHVVGKDLTEFSLETVKMFYDDASAAGFKIASVKIPARTPTGGTT
jgi:transaldolase